MISAISVNNNTYGIKNKMSAKNNPNFRANISYDLPKASTLFYILHSQEVQKLRTNGEANIAHAKRALQTLRDLIRGNEVTRTGERTFKSGGDTMFLNSTEDVILIDHPNDAKTNLWKPENSDDVDFDATVAALEKLEQPR